MAIFEDVTFGFKGNEYKVESSRVMMLIAKVEDIITLQDLTNGKAPKLSILAEAYSIALTYAGASVTIDEVYESLFGGEGVANVQNTVTSLIMLMLPPSSYHPQEGERGKEVQAD